MKRYQIICLLFVFGSCGPHLREGIVARRISTDAIPVFGYNIHYTKEYGQNSEENLPKKFGEGDLDMEIIGKEIKRIRRIKKISQTQLGVLIGVERSQIAKIKNAKKDTRISTVVRVFKALEVR